MEEGKKIMWTVGAQMITLAVGLLTIALIVWVASKAWKKGAESNYAGDKNPNWLGY